MTVTKACLKRGAFGDETYFLATALPSNLLGLGSRVRVSDAGVWVSVG